jgi:oxysterol-binding protein-related protein 9/10/11
MFSRPLNPVLGELFYGFWPDKGGRGRTNLIVEQVSHHPPITGYHIENKSRGLHLQGHSAQKTSFSGGAIIVKQIGHAILTVDLANGKKEEFLITLPRLRIDGLWYGSPYIELAETTKIQSSSGWLSTVCLPLILLQCCSFGYSDCLGRQLDRVQGQRILFRQDSLY